jgi:hypothetical protein
MAGLPMTRARSELFEKGKGLRAGACVWRAGGAGAGDLGAGPGVTSGPRGRRSGATGRCGARSCRSPGCCRTWPSCATCATCTRRASRSRRWRRWRRSGRSTGSGRTRSTRGRRRRRRCCRPSRRRWRGRPRCCRRGRHLGIGDASGSMTVKVGRAQGLDHGDGRGLLPGRAHEPDQRPGRVLRRRHLERGQEPPRGRARRPPGAAGLRAAPRSCAAAWAGPRSLARSWT